MHIEADDREKRLDDLTMKKSHEAADIVTFLQSDDPFAVTIRQMIVVFLQKRHDYSGEDGDAYKNFRACEAMDVKPWGAVMIRMTEKMARLHNFVKQGVLKVKDESVVDTFIDLANLSIISSILFVEDESERLKLMIDNKE